MIIDDTEENTEIETEEEESLEDALLKSAEEIESGETTETEAAPDSEETETDEAQAQPAEEVEQITPPNSWRADEKELFKTLPVAVQKQISERELQRERVFTQRTTELSKKLKQYGELDEIFEPYANELEARGATPAQVVRQLVAIQKMMDENPKETIARIAAGYGLTPEEFLIQEAQAQDGSNGNPQMKQILNELNALKASIAQREQLSVLEREQSQNDAMTKQEISAFAQEADTTGQPARPYFEQVMPIMTPLVKQLRSTYPEASHKEILNEAYNQAVWLHPAVRQKMIESEVAKNQGIKNQTAKAKKAAVSINGSPAGGSANAVIDKNASYEDDVRAAMEELS